MWYKTWHFFCCLTTSCPECVGGLTDPFNPSNAEATFVQSTRMQTFLKSIQTLLCWYSLDSSHRVRSGEYPFARVSIDHFSGFLHHFVLAKLAISRRGFNPFMLVWIWYIFEINFEIWHKFAKYLMESCRQSSEEHLSFKYFLKIALVREIPPKKPGCFGCYKHAWANPYMFTGSPWKYCQTGFLWI